MFDLKKIISLDFISDTRWVYFFLSVNCLCARGLGKRSMNLKVAKLFKEIIRQYKLNNEMNKYERFRESNYILKAEI